MPIYQGSNKIGDFYSGSNSIGWGYVGSNLVYQKSAYSADISCNASGAILYGYYAVFTITVPESVQSKVANYAFIIGGTEYDNGTTNTYSYTPSSVTYGSYKSVSAYGIVTWADGKTTQTKSTLVDITWVRPSLTVTGSFNDSTGAWKCTASYSPSTLPSGLTVYSKQWYYQTSSGGSWYYGSTDYSTSGTISEGEYRNYEFDIVFKDSLGNNSGTLEDSYSFKRSESVTATISSNAGNNGYVFADGNAVIYTVSLSESVSVSSYKFYIGGTLVQSGSSSTYSHNGTADTSETCYAVVVLSNGSQITTKNSITTNFLARPSDSISLTSSFNSSTGAFSISATIDSYYDVITKTCKWYYETGSGTTHDTGITSTYISGTLPDAQEYMYYYDVHYVDSTGGYIDDVAYTEWWQREIIYTVSISKNYTHLTAGHSVTFTATATSGVTKYVFVIDGTSYDNGTSNTKTYRPNLTSSGSKSVTAYVIAYWGSTSATSSTTGSVTWNYPSIAISASSSQGSSSSLYKMTATITGYSHVSGLTKSSWQWYRSSDGSSYSAISGATSTSYTSGNVASGLTRWFKCYVGFTDDTGNTEYFYSTARSCTTG